VCVLPFDALKKKYEYEVASMHISRDVADRVWQAALELDLDTLLVQVPDVIRKTLRARVQGSEEMQAGVLINFISRNKDYTLQHPGRHTLRLLGTAS
jgi:hypothetical protein